MDQFGMCGLLIDGIPLDTYEGAALLEYSVGETALKNETFQGVNRSSWHLLKAIFGLRQIKITIVFTGETRRQVALQRSKLNGALFGASELYISADGFFYDVTLESCGAEVLIGEGDRETKIKSEYTFKGTRRDALVTETIPGGGSIFCASTLPYTDARLTVNVQDSAQYSGNPIVVKNSGPDVITALSAAIPPSLTGETRLHISQRSPGHGSDAYTNYRKTVYGGNIDATGGILTETYGGGAYDPANIPADLKSIIDANTTEETASGDIASFNCELGEYPITNLTVDIEPAQNLNGYDNPWPAGGGKNLAKVTDGTFIKNGVTFTYTNDEIRLNGTCTGNTWIVPSVRQEIVLPAGTYTMSVEVTGVTGSGNLAAYGVNNKSIGYLYVSNSGAKVSKTFTLESELTATCDGYIYGGNVYNNAQIKFQIESGSTATSYTPYSNICPISGWTGAKVTRTGRNLLDPAYRYESAVTSNYHVRYYYRGPTYPYNEKLLLKKGVTYTFSFTGAANASGIYIYTSETNRQFIVYNKNAITFTPTEDCYGAVDVYWANAVDVANVVCQLEVGSTASSYEAYQGQTYNIDLDGTRYGGSLDVLAGKLTVTDGYIASYNGETLPSTWISDRDVYAAGTNPTNGAEVVYKLATPIVYDLTPTEVSTLLGTNNVWADTGAVDLAYRDGNVSAMTELLTQSDALISGQNVTYPLSSPVVSNVTQMQPLSLVPGNVTITGNGGDMQITVSKQIPNPYPLGGAEFDNVSAGDVLVFDGIDGKITKNGENAAASVNWTDFPQLTPGNNTIAAADPVTVEYYPTYI